MVMTTRQRIENRGVELKEDSDSDSTTDNDDKEDNEDEDKDKNNEDEDDAIRVVWANSTCFFFHFGFFFFTDLYLQVLWSYGSTYRGLQREERAQTNMYRVVWAIRKFFINIICVFLHILIT